MGHWTFPMAGGYRLPRCGRPCHPGTRLLHRAIGRGRPHCFGGALGGWGWPRRMAVRVTLGRVSSSHGAEALVSASCTRRSRGYGQATTAPAGGWWKGVRASAFIS